MCGLRTFILGTHPLVRSCRVTHRLRAAIPLRVWEINISSERTVPRVNQNGRMEEKRGALTSTEKKCPDFQRSVKRTFELTNRTVLFILFVSAALLIPAITSQTRSGPDDQKRSSDTSCP
jgi:hypothetical protein